MPRNSSLSGLGLRTLEAGTTSTVFSARDFGPDMVQFAVSTTQPLNSTLLLWLCDESGQEVSPIHAGPPISFETDSKFRLKNKGGASVTYCMAVLQSRGVGGTHSGGGQSSGDGTGWLSNQQVQSLLSAFGSFLSQFRR